MATQKHILTEDVRHVPIDRVQPHPENPRDGDINAIWESIEEHGFFGALVVQKSSGYILAGNHRWRAAREAGMSEVPVMYADVGDEEALRILLADNRTSDVAEYEDEKLADVLDHLAHTDAGLTGTGYKQDDLDSLLADVGKVDPVEEIDLPEPGEVTDPEVDSECKIVIHCSNEDRNDFAPTLSDWDERTSVEVNISA